MCVFHDADYCVDPYPDVTHLKRPTCLLFTTDEGSQEEGAQGQLKTGTCRLCKAVGEKARCAAQPASADLTAAAAAAAAGNVPPPGIRVRHSY